MATAVIIDDYRNRKAIPTATNHPITKIKYDSPITEIKSVLTTTIPTSVNHPISEISYLAHLSVINSILPFRVRFTTIGIEGYSSDNPPGIGIQVIGYSNYII
jgi:hypothetical protein